MTTKKIINLNTQITPASFTLSHFDPDIFVSALLSNTFRPRTHFINATHTHPYKTTTKFTALRTSVFTFSGNT